MAYGVTSTTLLLAIGTNPAAASATVHFAEIGTTLMSGVAHWKFGNVAGRVAARIGAPGGVGPSLGPPPLSPLPPGAAARVFSLFLLILGISPLLPSPLGALTRRNLGKPM